jgi:hypothetical protein
MSVPGCESMVSAFGDTRLPYSRAQAKQSADARAPVMRAEIYGVDICE